MIIHDDIQFVIDWSSICHAKSMKSRGSGPQNRPFWTNFGSQNPRSGASQDPGIPLYGSSMVPEGLPGVHSGSHRGGHIVASLYIPSRARVGRIGSDSMIHILQNVTFGMSHFGLLTRFCRNVSEGEIRGVQIRPDLGPIWDPKMDPIWDPKMDPILGPILDPQIGPMAP